MKPAIIYLAQNTPMDVQHQRDSRSMLEKSLDLLYRNYNGRFKTPIVIFHEGDFDKKAQREVARGRKEIQFEAIEFKVPDFLDPTTIPEQWIPPSELQINTSVGRAAAGELRMRKRRARLPRRRYRDKPTSPTATPYSWNMGHRHMCRFYGVTVWDYAAELGYDWVMRFDDDSYLHSPVEYDMFRMLESRGYRYGYRVDCYEPGELSLEFGDWIMAWMASRKIKPTFLMDYVVEGVYNLRGYYNNWFATDVNFWRSEPVQELIRDIDQSGKIYTNRWNDLVIQAAAVQIFMPKKQVFKFADWTYEHTSCDRRTGKMGWGGLFIGAQHEAADAERLRKRHIAAYGKVVANSMTF